jgi:hypothetical protein
MRLVTGWPGPRARIIVSLDPDSFVAGSPRVSPTLPSALGILEKGRTET